MCPECGEGSFSAVNARMGLRKPGRRMEWRRWEEEKTRLSDEMTTTDGKSRRSAVEGQMGMLGIATGERRSEEMAIDSRGS